MTEELKAAPAMGERKTPAVVTAPADAAELARVIAQIASCRFTNSAGNSQRMSRDMIVNIARQACVKAGIQFYGGQAIRALAGKAGG
jgi:hypothetical protein